MISKKLTIWIFTVLFVVITFIAIIFAFSVGKIDTQYTLIGDIETKSSALDQKLNVYLGKNLLFLNEDEIKSVINENPYTECVSVVKNFPDTLKVYVRERREVYVINYNEKFYLTDETGFVLSEYSGAYSREYILLSFVDFEIEDPIVGQAVSSENSDILNSAFTVVQSVNLTDCVKEVKIIKTFPAPLATYDLELCTYTGATIVIKKFNDDGIIKAKKAFDYYNDDTSEYKKSFYYYEAIKTDEGEILTFWTTEK